MQVTKTVYLFATPSEHWDFDSHSLKKDVSLTVWPHATYADKEPVSSVEVAFEVPDNLDYYDLKLKELQKQKENLQAEFTKRLTEIQAQINEHLAIEAQ